jgi:adenine-specific DNA-methyltransferase
LDVHQTLNVEPPLVLADAPPLERDWERLTGEQVGAAYVEALSDSTRARHGRHYTPPQLASELWAMTKRALGLKAEVNALPGLVRDPACGAGALLLPALREHFVASWNTDPRLVLAALPSLLQGVDTDPAAVWVANVVLAAEMLPTFARVPERHRRPLPALARVGDGLAPDLAPARAVVMNPPYGRVRLSAADRARFADTLYGHANLYGIFVAAAEQALAQDGVLAALVPTSFTAGRYFAPLRGMLSSRLRLQAVGFVEDRSGVFGSVLQETCLATFTRKRARRTTVTSIGSGVSTVATVDTPRGEGPWLLPRRTDLAQIAAAAAGLPLTLADCGWRVSTGPLVWNRRKDDLYARPGKDRHLIVWAADIDGGRLHRDPARNNTRYLRLTDKEHAAYLLTEPAILAQRTTAPEQPRRIVAAELTADDLAAWGDVVVENHVNIIRPATLVPLLTPRLLYRLLTAETIDRLLRCISGSVALSAYELESLRLPDADTLTRWETLSQEALEREVAVTYRAM